MTKKTLNEAIENGALSDMTQSVVEAQSRRGNVQSLENNTNTDLITLKETLLLNYWNKKGILRTFVCLPIDDALKGDLKITADNIDEDGINELHKAYVELAKNEIAELGYWARHFGGSGLITLTPEKSGGSTLQDPFVKTKKNQEVSFMAIDRWRLGGKSGYNTDSIKTLISSNGLHYYAGKSVTGVNGTPVDNSRIKTMIGDSAPIITRQSLNGWGLSILEKIAQSLDNYDKGLNLIYELMKEGKTNVIKVKGLLDSLRAGQFNDIVKVVTESTFLKQQINTMIMDGDDDYTQTQASLSGFDSVLKELRIAIASDLRMPMTKLFGISASGFNSGEDDIENYNSMINSTIRPKLRPIIQDVLETLCYSVLGVEPKGLTFEFAPLKEIDQVTQEDINDKRYYRLKDMLISELIDEEEFKTRIEKLK